MRSNRFLAPLLALVFALTGSATAHAAEFHLILEKNPETIGFVQSGPSVFTGDPGSVTCKSVLGFGQTATATTPTLTFTTLEYKECTLVTIFGNIAVTVDFHGCDMKFDAGGEWHLICAAGKGPWTMTGPGCTITVPAQTNKGLTYENTGLGEARVVDAIFNLAGLKYSYSGFTCGSGSGTTNGTVTGKVVVSGKKATWWE